MTTTLKRKLFGVVAGVALGLLQTGCKTTETYSMVCFSPQEGKQVSTPSDVLSDLRATIPFEIAENDFACRRMGSDVLAWVVCQNRAQRSAITSALNNSEHYRFVSIGYFDSADRDIFLLGPEASDPKL